MAQQIDFSSVFDSVLPNVYIRKISLVPSSFAGARNTPAYDEDQEYEYQVNEFGRSTLQSYQARVGDIPRNAEGLRVNVELEIKDRFVGKKGSKKEPYWYNDEELLKHLKIRVILCKHEDTTKDLLNRRLTTKYIKRASVARKLDVRVIDASKNAHTELTSFKRSVVDKRKVFSVTYNMSFNVQNYNPNHMSIFAHTMVDLNEVALSRSTFVKSRKNYLQGNTSAETVIVSGEVKTDADVYILPNNKVWAGPAHYHDKRGWMEGATHTSRRHRRLQKRTVPNIVVEDHRVLTMAEEATVNIRPYRKPQTRKKLKNRQAQGAKIMRKTPFISEPMYSVNSINELKFVFFMDFRKIVLENSQYSDFLESADQKAKFNAFQMCPIKNIRVFKHQVQRGLRRGKPKKAQSGLCHFSTIEERGNLVAYSSERTPGLVPRRANSRPLQPNEEESERVTIGVIKEIDLSVKASPGIRSFAISDYDMAKRTDGLYSYSVEVEIHDGIPDFIEQQLASLTQAKNRLIEYRGLCQRRGSVNNATGQFSRKFIRNQMKEYGMPKDEDILAQSRRARRRAVQRSMSDAPWLNAVATYCDVLHTFTSLNETRVSKLATTLNLMSAPDTGDLQGVEKLEHLMNNLEGKIKRKIGAISRPMDEYDLDSRTSAFKGKSPRGSIFIKKDFKEIHDSNVPNNMGYDFLDIGRKKSVGPPSLTYGQFRQRMDEEHEKYFNSRVDGSSRRPPPADTATEEDTERADSLAAKIDLRDSYYSYLSPAEIRCGQRRLRTTARGPSIWSPKQYNAMVSRILSSNTSITRETKDILDTADPYRPKYSLSTPIDPPPPVDTGPTDVVDVDPHEINYAAESVFALSGITILPTAVYEFQVATVEAAEVENDRYVSPDSLLGDDSKFITDKFEPIEEEILIEEETNTVYANEDVSEFAGAIMGDLLSTEDTGPILKGTKLRKIHDISPRNSENIVEKYFSRVKQGGARKAGFIKFLPNQVKSIVLGHRDEVDKNWFATKDEEGIDLVKSSDYTGLFYFNYQHLCMIQVLVGFEKDESGRPQVSSPIFRRMSSSHFEKIRLKEQSVVCRLVPYRVKELGFGQSPRVRMPTFHEYFVIKPRTRSIDNPPSQQVPLEASPQDTTEDIREGLYFGRLTEYAPLNEVGTRLLRQMLKSNKKINGIPSEYVRTALVQQPYTVTKVGTRFGESPPDRTDAPQASDLTSAFAAATPAASTPMAPTAPTRGPTGGGY